MARRDSSLSADVAQSLDIEAIVFACQALGLGARLAAAAEPREVGLPSVEDWRELMTRFVESIDPSQS